MLFSIFYAVFYFPFKRIAAGIRGWLLLLLGFSLAAAVAAIVHSPMLLAAARELSSQDNYVAYPTWSMAAFSADALSLMIPTGVSQFMGPLFAGTTANFNPAEATYLGWTALLLAYAGAIFYWRRKDVWLWILAGLFFGICALGPYLIVNGQGYGVPLPFFIISRIPLIDFVREPCRYIVITSLAVSVLAAFGFSGLIGRLKTAGLHRAAMPAALLIILALICLEYKAPISLNSPKPPAVYEQIGASEIEGSVVTLPLGWYSGFSLVGDERTFVELFQQAHKRPLIGGEVSRAPRVKVLGGLYTPVIDFLADTSLEPSDIDRDPAVIAREMQHYNIAFIVVSKVNPDSYSDGKWVSGIQILPEETLHRIDRYVTQSLGMEKFEESDETVSYRRRD